MPSQSKHRLFVLDPMHFDSLVVGASEEKLAIITVVQASDWCVVSLDRERISFSIVCPNFDSLVL